MPLPDINNVDFSVGGSKNQHLREMLDYAINQWHVKSVKTKTLAKLYDSYNGVSDKSENEAVTKSTGKESKTKYIKYRLGRTKLKQLHGEFLEINLTPTVTTTNRDAITKKMDKYKESLGLAMGKPYIEKAREMGYDVFPGMQIPDIKNKRFWDINNFKLTNERIMQNIIDDKMLTQKLKSRFYQNFIDLTIAAEIYSKVERDVNGIDTVRYIPIQYGIYEESISDMFCDQSPYMGEVRPMYFHEIATNKEFNLSREQLNTLKDSLGDSASYSVNDVEMVNNAHLINTYTIQWKGLEPVIVKIAQNDGSEVPYMRILSEEYYKSNKAQIDRDVQKGKYEIEKYNREILWTASRVGSNIYVPAKKETNLIQRLNKNNIYNVEYDYTCMLFCTVNGVRVSIQEVIYELERVYDDIRFAINREMKKLKGSLVGLDGAYFPKGMRYNDIIHKITEDGVVHFNSSAEGNVSGTDGSNNTVGITAVNLGNNQNLTILLNQAMDIERVMDRVTGMNDNRQGISAPTTTATANVNNIEASRSMTYDLFYFMQEYVNRVLSKLAEKTKINRTYYGEDSREFIFDDGDTAYMMSTKDLAADNYGVTITDGKKERSIMSKIEQLFPQEINSGGLRSKDAAKFWMESSFSAAMRVLDNAYEEIARMRQEDMKIKNEQQKYATDTQLQISREDREDKQQHEKDLELLSIEGKKEIAQISGAMKLQSDSTKAAAQSAEVENKPMGM